MNNNKVMKGMFFLGFAFLVFVSSLPLLSAPVNREANRLAREGTKAANNKQWDEAIDALRKAAELDRKYAPNLATALQQRAAARVTDGKFSEAVSDLDDAIKIQPREARIYESRAYAEMKLNNPDKALADYSEAIKLNPHEVRYYQVRSYIREVKGDYKGSMADAEKILKTGQEQRRSAGP